MPNQNPLNHSSPTKQTPLGTTAEQLKTQLEKLTLNSSGQVEDVLMNRLSDSVNCNVPRMPTKAPLPTCNYFPTPKKDGLVVGGKKCHPIKQKEAAQGQSNQNQNSAIEKETTSKDPHSRSPFKNIMTNGQITRSPITPTDKRKISDKITINKSLLSPENQANQKLVTKTMKYRYFICIDFEATCDGDVVVRDGKVSFRSNRSRGEKFENEIISFPCVIVDIFWGGGKSEIFWSRKKISNFFQKIFPHHPLPSSTKQSSTNSTPTSNPPSTPP